MQIGLKAVEKINLWGADQLLSLAELEILPRTTSVSGSRENLNQGPSNIEFDALYNSATPLMTA